MYLIAESQWVNLKLPFLENYQTALIVLIRLQLFCKSIELLCNESQVSYFHSLKSGQIILLLVRRQPASNVLSCDRKRFLPYVVL
ncbi:uncharacterized protein Bfra_000250 [Botrytis fragariae]|uniref:Uncharacterized protein n=1 Tax=Botrytis fragariae TaxID=1964551 RepID=A0A8H6B2T1_9HELO|nr:uncharacterized protein Bfra_000250 [Botrytis fragariae]KAF5878083.1 hypothetical protein Bfra_000250 [Botrytis fragariae]